MLEKKIDELRFTRPNKKVIDADVDLPKSMVCLDRPSVNERSYICGSTAPLKFGKVKTSKIRRDLRQLSTLTANISRTGHDIDKGTQTSSRAIPGALDKKFGELLFTKKVIDADVDLPKIDCAHNFEQLQCSVAHISETDQDINNWKKKELVDRHLLPVGEKIDELWFTNKKVIDADVDPPKFKIRRDFGQLETLSANILERIDIPKIDSKLDRLPSLPR